jgi:hypothetical protein
VLLELWCFFLPISGLPTPVLLLLLVRLLLSWPLPICMEEALPTTPALLLLVLVLVLLQLLLLQLLLLSWPLALPVSGPPPPRGLAG